MTNVLDPAAQTRLIDPRTEQTAVLRSDRDESTHLLRHRRALPPTQPLRRGDAHPDMAHDTGEVPLLGPTGAELVVADRLGLMPPVGPQPRPGPPPTPPPGPPVPPPAWNQRVGEWPTVKPLGERGKRRRPAPVWAWVLATAALSLVSGATGGGIVLALAVLEATR